MNFFSQAASLARVRMQLFFTRCQKIWYWFLRTARSIQISVVLMLVTSVIFSRWTVHIHNNAPARYGMLVSFLIYLYVVRKVVGPIFFVEIGMTIWQRSVALLPDWLQWLAPRKKAIQPSHDSRLVWHETTISGNVFHIISTVWLWAEVFLFACGVLPVWNGNNYSAVVMLTVMTVFFVATEDFRDVKKWRNRLGLITALVGIGFVFPMFYQKFAPGNSRLQMTKWYQSQRQQEVEADAVQAQTEADAQYLADLYRQDAELRKSYREHQKHDFSPQGQYDQDWTAQQSLRWQSVSQRIREYKDLVQSSQGNQKKKLSEIHGWISRNLELFLLIVMGVFLGAYYVKNGGPEVETSGGHQDH